MTEGIRTELDEIRGILAAVAQQQAHNTVAIAQLTLGIERLRQTVADQNRMVQSNRADVAQHASDPSAHQGSDRDE